eukprot:Protomagalhaensia_wolfi_Nauph_80__4406@NODE_450_length_2512_cov_17_975738_g338_i0_p3_GENE_NODE_450_length_2512_cov_17_975738_g338_i0NODE_450_length_2512_cov_17_975738_g338_i0_p3_ORF_typecomplete_len100_score10_77DUF2282/PF10048_9/29DUF2282/PF10048_9/7_3_NODE_450_length_2512_cov_17_975738_g338_i016261925
MIINGGVECGGCNNEDRAANRYKFLQRYTFLMGVPLCRRPQDVLACAGTASYDNVAQWDSMPQTCSTWTSHSLHTSNSIHFQLLITHFVKNQISKLAQI